MTCPSWVALRGMYYSFIELDKAVVHVISLVHFLCLWFSFYLDKRLMEASCWERLTVGKTGSCSDGWGSIPSLLFDLRQNYSGGNEDNGDLLPKVPCTHCCPQCPDPAAGRCWPTPPLETPGHSQASLGQSLWSHCSYLLGPGAHKVLFMPSRSLFPQSCVSSVIKSHLPPKSNSLGVLKAPQSRRADDPKEAII